MKYGRAGAVAPWQRPLAAAIRDFGLRNLPTPSDLSIAQGLEPFVSLVAALEDAGATPQKFETLIAILGNDSTLPANVAARITSYPSYAWPLLVGALVPSILVGGRFLAWRSALFAVRRMRLEIAVDAELHGL